MFVTVDRHLLRSQDYDRCLRNACDQLYRQHINNFIHYARDQHPIFRAYDFYLSRLVELTDTHTFFIPVVDQKNGGIELLEVPDENHNHSER